MIRLFKHYLPYAVLVLGMADFVLLLLAAEAGSNLWLWQLGSPPGSVSARWPRIMGFAVALEGALIAVGAYGGEALHSLRAAAARLLVAIAIGVLFLALLSFLFRDAAPWPSYSVYAMGIALAGLMGVRFCFFTALGPATFKRRLLVLGAGHRAERIRALARAPGAGFLIVGYVAMKEGPPRISAAISRDAIEDLADHVGRLNAGEVVLALDERRNATPLADLLRIKAAGVHVNEISTFLERETGRVDLESVHPSQLLFSDGLSAGRRLSGIAKRLFDLVAGLLLSILTLPLVALAALLVKLESPGPAFVQQCHVGRYGQDMWLMKLRSTRVDDPRVTRVGRLIRALRIDHLPRLWAILQGRMSFVGPHPECPRYAADLERDLPYHAERHMVRPGLTGWAQIRHPRGAGLDDARQTLEYDLYYARNYTPFLDILILLQTVRLLLWREGGR